MNLDIETSSWCNRHCRTCLRNSYPDRSLANSWFTKGNVLPEEIIYDAVRQADAIHEFEWICLSFYNEPLADDRLPKILKEIKSITSIPVYFHSNGDYLTNELAVALDGQVDRIVFTLYHDGEERSKKINNMFTETHIVTILDPIHVPTHFSPAYPVTHLAGKYKDHNCIVPRMHVIINHKGQYANCCDDFGALFNLGTFPEKSIQEHLQEKQDVISKLAIPGGRNFHFLCATCPRP